MIWTVIKMPIEIQLIRNKLFILEAYLFWVLKVGFIYILRMKFLQINLQSVEK